MSSHTKHVHGPVQDRLLFPCYCTATTMLLHCVISLLACHYTVTTLLLNCYICTALLLRLFARKACCPNACVLAITATIVF